MMSTSSSALWITDQCIHVSAAPGNKLPSEQGTEEDQEEKGGDEKEIEEENKNRDEESHGLSDVSSDSSRVEKDKEPLAVSSQGLSAWRTDFKDVEDMNFFYYEVCEQNIRCFRRICLQGVRKETTLNVLCECSTSAQYDLVKTHDKDPFIWFLLSCNMYVFSFGLQTITQMKPYRSLFLKLKTTPRHLKHYKGPQLVTSFI